MEVTNELVPYIVKKYKILAVEDTENAVHVAYVEKIDGEELEQLQGFIGKQVIFRRQVRMRDFWKMARQMYPEVSFKVEEEETGYAEEKVEKKVEEKPKPQRKKKEPKPVEEPVSEETLDLSSIATEDLVAELRNRQIKTEAEAFIEIKPDRSAAFEFTKLGWPVGKFKAKLNIIEEVPPQPTPAKAE